MSKAQKSSNLTISLKIFQLLIQVLTLLRKGKGISIFFHVKIFLILLIWSHFCKEKIFCHFIGEKLENIYEKTDFWKKEFGNMFQEAKNFLLSFSVERAYFEKFK